MNNVIKIGLGLALAVVYPFMIGFGIEAFYTSPKEPYEICLSLDPNAREQEVPKSISVDPKTDPEYKKCFDAAQETLDIYNRNLFLVATGFGFAAIAVGTLLLSEKIGPVGPSLIFGGLFTILYGNARTVRSIDKRWIFLELVFVFAGLIYITWRYLQVSKKK